MANLKYDKEITALLLIDPYNDFISEEAKYGIDLKTVAETNNCIRLRMASGHCRIHFGRRRECLTKRKTSTSSAILGTPFGSLRTQGRQSAVRPDKAQVPAVEFYNCVAR